MNEPTITCPSCRTEIKLNESLAAPLIEATRQQYEKALSLKESDFSKRESAIREQQAALLKEKQSIDEQVLARLKPEREKIAAEERQNARLILTNDLDQKAKELANLQAVLKERDTKLAEAQAAQAELIRKQRELDDARREMELTIETRIQESLTAVRDKARLEAEGVLKLKVLEKEEQITSMQRQIEELRRKAEQGSQQLQGEAQELQLESLLRDRFPRDIIEPVPKGEFGGDVLHHVQNPQGQPCGAILWESKRTKNWSDTWLPKLREDQRAAKAELALIVSHALPKGIETFGFVDGVWITESRCAIPVAIALREHLIHLTAARQAGEGQLTKMEMVYQYLTGPQFRHRIEAVVEKLSDMQSDLEKERKMMTRQWAKRQEQIRCAAESTVGMFGDFQGIAGRALQEIDGLDVPLLEAPEPTVE
jgi:hypothetical protein